MRTFRKPVWRCSEKFATLSLYQSRQKLRIDLSLGGRADNSGRMAPSCIIHAIASDSLLAGGALTGRARCTAASNTPRTRLQPCLQLCPREPARAVSGWRTAVSQPPLGETPP